MNFFKYELNIYYKIYLKTYPEKSLILLFKSISTFRKWTKINVQFSKNRKHFPKKGVFVTEMSF